MSLMSRYNKPAEGEPETPVEPVAETDAPVVKKSHHKKPGRKPQAAVAAVQSAGIAPTADQWQQLIAALAQNKTADMEVAANLHAQAMKKALRPENEIAPAVSVYNPKGETKNPRPKPSHIYMMGPYPIADPGDYQTVTWTELELLNQLKPGTFRVTKADGSEVKLTVKTDFATDDITPYRTTLIMPIANDEQKEGWPPLMQVLTEVITGEQPMQSYARLQAIIDKQAAELTALKAAHAA